MVGASGSGKSSLVRAGLVPAIRRGEKLADDSYPPRWSHRWLVHVITPTAHPLEALATSLTREGGSVSTTASLIDDLAADPRSLHLYARRMTHIRNAPRLLLVVDQFEELFTLCRSESERGAFIENLLLAAGVEMPAPEEVVEGVLLNPSGQDSPQAANPVGGDGPLVADPVGHDGPLVAVIALRADFYSHCAQYARLRSALSARQEYIGPMSPDELRRAIEQPAVQNEWEFEPGLVDLILHEVSDEPGGLPLLSHALLETWHRRRGRALTLKGYAEAGGIHRAIAQTAESVYTDMSPENRELARRIFLRLTELGEGTQDTRRRASLSELSPSPDAVPQVEAVLNTLVEARLVTAGEGTVEVAHEALIREWPALRQWLDENRDSLRLHRHLTDAAQAWEEMDRDPGELYRGARLAQALEWAGMVENAGMLNELERAFLEASQELEDRKIAEREAQRQRELEAAQKVARAERQRAELQAQSTHRLRRRALYLVGALILALVMAGVAVFFADRNSALAVQNAERAQYANTQQAVAEIERAKAEAARVESEGLASLRSRDAQVNQSLALAAQSQIALQGSDPDLALALAWEANQIPDPPGRAQMALSEAAYAPGTVRVYLGHEAQVFSVAVSPDGRYGLSGDESGVIYLWDLDTGEALRRLEGHTDLVRSLAFTPDGRHAVSASQDETLIYWDLERGEIIHRLSGHGDGVNTVAISPDGRFAASGSGMLWEWDPWINVDNSVRIWDLQSGQEIRRFTLSRTSIQDVKYTPDGERLVIGTMWDDFILLDIQTGKVLSRREIACIMDVALTTDGRFAVVISQDWFIHKIDLQTGEQLATEFERHNGTVFGLDISPDGERLLSSSSKIIEYNLETGEVLNRFYFDAYAIAYLPDGRSALIGSRDQTLRLLEFESGAEIGRLPTARGLIGGAAYHPDGRSLVRTEDKYLSMRDTETGEEIWNAVNEYWYFDTIFSPDGTQVLAGGWIAFAGLYDAASGELLTRLESDGIFVGDMIGAVDAVAFHPSGKFVLTGAQGEKDYLIYWDLESGKPVWIFDPTEGEVMGVAISPDGRTALSGEVGGLVEWWDLETGQLIRGLEGHTGTAWGVAFVDDRTALSGSDDGTMILWDLESGTALQRYLGHTDGIKRIAVSPDKRLALTSSRDGTMILWDIQGGEPLRRYSGHTDQLQPVDWHPDGGEALSGGLLDGQLIRWRIDADLESFMAWVEQNRYIRPLTCAERDAFHILPLCERADSLPAAGADEAPAPPQGSGAALPPPLPTPTPLASPLASTPIAAQLAGAAAWGVNRGAVPLGGGQVWEYTGNAGDQLSMRVSADQPVNITWGIERQRENGLLDPTLSLYAPDGSLVAEIDDVANGIATDIYLESLTLPQSGVYRIEVRSYQDQTAGGYRLVLADPRRLEYRPSPDFDGALTGLTLHPDGYRLLAAQRVTEYPEKAEASGTEIYSIWVWDLGSGEVVQQLEGHQAWITGLDISPDGRQVLSTDAGGTAILWDLESGDEVSRFENSGSVIIFHPDGQTALGSTLDHNLALWDLASGEVLRAFEGHALRVNDLLLSPDGEIVYSTSKDNTVRAWRFATGDLIATYQPFAEEATNALAISPDGSRLLVGNDYLSAYSMADQRFITGARIAVLDTDTGETLMVLEGHTGGVKSIDLSPDGRYALSGSDDRTLRLWDLSTGEQLALLIGHTYDVTGVAFSPDDLTAYTTSRDGTWRVWDLRDYIGS